MAALAQAALVLLCATVAHAGHSFKKGDKIPTYVNKVGPYFNTHETYHFYSLPVCRPDKIVSRSLTLGEVLDGDRMAEGLYDIRFGQNKDTTELCSVQLSASDIQQLSDAIDDLFYFEFVIDDLPVRGFIGQLEEHLLDIPRTHRVFLWTHMHFHLEYNGAQIVNINVTEKEAEIELPYLTTEDERFEVTYTYSVSWSESKLSFSHRGLHGKKFFPTTLEIHWLSIINSAVLVVLLLGFVSIIVARAVNNDLTRYSMPDDLDIDHDVNDEQGWKMVHSDVFRFPQYKSLLSACLGNGAQFLTLAICVVMLAVTGWFNRHRHHSMTTAVILLYVGSSFVSGYVSNTFYVQMGGETWAWNLMLTAGLFVVPFFLGWSIINSVAWALGSTQALPATTIVLLLLVWLLAGFPLTVVGGILGKNNAGLFDSPCRTKKIAREIPLTPWYRNVGMQMLIGGFLPFSAISVELYYIFATVWGREHYTLYGVLMLVFFILLAVTGCITLALTYFQLSGEDYRWWWRSFLSAGATGLFVMCYAVFYFQVRSNMSGLLQSIQFFGYTLMACYAFFLMLGTVGFYTSLYFVKYLYRNVKLD